MRDSEDEETGMGCGVMTPERLEEIRKMSLELAPEPWVKIINELLVEVSRLERIVENQRTYCEEPINAGRFAFGTRE